MAIAGNNLFAGSYNRIFQSTDDGLSWNTVAHGLGGMTINSLESYNNRLLVGTNGGSILISENNGKSWSEIIEGIPNTSINAFAVKNDSVFAGTGYGVFVKKWDSSFWLPIHSGLKSLSTSDIVIHEGNIYLSTTGGGVFLWDDTYKKWNEVNSGITDFDVTSLASDGDNLYAATKTSGIFKSSNYGNNWLPFNNGLTSLSIEDIAVGEGNIFLGSSDGDVFVSKDHGASWSSINNGLVTSQVYKVFVHESNLFAGTQNGIFYSSNSGENWSSINEGISNVITTEILVKDSILYAGTHEHGVWKRPLSDIITSIGNIEPDSPSTFALLQNYPNPFNPSTIIEYTIPNSVGDAKFASPTNVTLIIYDVLGREIETLVDEYKIPGNYKVKWNADEFSSGIYIYRLATNSGYHIANTMSLIK